MPKLMDENLIIFTPEFVKQREYWISKLKGNIINTQIPSNFTGSQPLMGCKETVNIEIPNEIYKDLMNLSKGNDLSLYIILLAALKSLLYRYTNIEDIIIISPIREQLVTDLTINNRVFIRDKVHNDMTFKELILVIRESVLKAYENQDYPFDALIKHLFHNRGNSENQTVSSVACSLDTLHNRLNSRELHSKITFFFEKKEQGILGRIIYDTHFYEKFFMKQISRHFAAVLEDVFRDINIKISEIDFLGKIEKEQLLMDFNQNKVEYPSGKAIHHLIEEQVKNTPEAIAVVFKGRQMSVRVLNAKANRLATVLRLEGVKADVMVGIMMKPSVEIIIGIMAVLKAGGAYLPIDWEYPKERKKYFLKDSNTKLLLTNRGIKAVHDCIPDNTRILDVKGNEIQQDLRDEKNLKSINKSWDSVYLIYTSGSTGKPKGVMVEHLGLVNYIEWAIKNYVRNERANFPFFTSISFDLTVTSIFTPLCSGNSIFIYNEENKNLLMKRIIEENRVEVVKLTPSHLKLIKETGMLDGISSKIKRFIVGGEKLNVGLTMEINQLCQGKIEIYNEYGPTESIVGCMIHPFNPTSDTETIDSIPIGKPADNVKIYILDERNNPVPVGVAGEILISGVGIARGYLNRVERTQCKFTANPFIKGEIAYRSGDIAKHLSTGDIEFLTRKDSQVNIRGFRIELGEIENRLLEHSDIKESVVLSKEDKFGGPYLCAYIVSNKESLCAELPSYLLKYLPGYMIPSFFILIEDIPLNKNGKIDKDALPDPGIKTGEDFVRPRNEKEEKLVKIWADVLGLETEAIGIDDNFFEVGGHSLKAIILAAKIHKELNTKISLEELFNMQTIRELSGFIKKTKDIRYVEIKPVEKRGYYPLSSAQKRLYFLQQMNWNSTNYNLPRILSLSSQVNNDKLEGAFKELIARHESLRTSFGLKGRQLVQYVHDKVDFKVNHSEIKTHEEEPKIQKIKEDFLRPFDFSQAPLFRASLIKTTGERHILMYDMHHIITDGMSQTLLEKEIIWLYNNEAILPSLRLQYKDYAHWQNSEEQKILIKQQEAYWLKLFSNDLVPVLKLPTDFPRSAHRSFEGSCVTFQLNKKDLLDIKIIAERAGVTLYMFTLSVFYILISKLCSQEDIVIGSPSSGRRHADLENIMGMFVNTLAIRNYPSGDKTFEEFLKEVKMQTLKAFDNQDYQFEDLVDKLNLKRNIHRNPLFDVFFNLGKIDVSPPELTELKVEPYQYENIQSKFDLDVYGIELGESLNFSFIYCTKLFRKETIHKFIQYFKEIISSVVKNPNQKISAIEMIPVEDRDRVYSLIQSDQEEISIDLDI